MSSPFDRISYPEYADVMSKVYTLSRLRKSRSMITDSIVRIGGRYTNSGVSSGADILPIEGISGASYGDLIILSCNLKDFDSCSPLQPLKVLDYQIVHRIKDPEQAKVTENIDFAYGSNLNWKNSGEVSLWSDFLHAVRGYFHREGFTEVTTPSLVCNPGMEPELEPFSTVWRTGSHQKTMFLPTSPELHMKKIMAKGHFDIFEVKTVFRNEMVTDIHKPEFMMLEWYRGFADLEAIKIDLTGLLTELESLFSKAFHSSRKMGTINEFTVRQILKEHLNFDLRPDTSSDELMALANSLHLKCEPNWSWNDIFHLIWVHSVEPKLSKQLFILRQYPPTQAALAKIDEEGWADRFELYWGGIEIANAFNELTDVQEQRKRFTKDQKLRREYGRTPLEIDEDFLTALEMGIPPTGGIALGLDRLFNQMIYHYR